MYRFGLGGYLRKRRDKRAEGPLNADAIIKVVKQAMTAIAYVFVSRDIVIDIETGKGNYCQRGTRQ